MKTSILDRFCLRAAIVLFVAFFPEVHAEDAGGTLWTTGGALLPAWGLYPNGSEYGGTVSLGGVSAWTAGSGSWPLTWVADVPAAGQYNVWVRRYAGYGSVRVSVDEKPVTGGKGGPGGARYAWEQLGTASLSPGRHHVDVAVESCMFDAVLLTRDGNLEPETAKLPEPMRAPVTRALRIYRDDSHLSQAAGESGFVVASVTAYEEVLYDFLPAETQLIRALKLWGAPGQYVGGTFAVRALAEATEFRVSITDLIGPKEATPLVDADMRVVRVWEKKACLFERTSAVRTTIPDMLLKDDRTGIPPKGKQGGFGGRTCVSSIPAHQSRQFWLTLRIPPGSPPGMYGGKVQFEVAGAAGRGFLLPIEVDVLPIDLRLAEGYNSIFYVGRPENSTGDGASIPLDRFREELADLVRHGLNATVLYGGASTMRYAREAGMTKPPCMPHWPDGDNPKEVAEAKALGFPDVLFYGVDEPNAPQDIERCRAEAERRLKAGLHTFNAINSVAAQEATKEVIDYPVYVTYNFDGKDNPAVLYARSKGFHPVSYWATGLSYPLHNRALAGLYNKACGYEGSAPWAYYDYADARMYDSDLYRDGITYPDEFGSPIPTLRWEAYRDGIDDVRYLEALDRAIAAARGQLLKPDPPPGLDDALAGAERVRKDRFESIGGRWFQYLCSLSPGDLEPARRDMADATVRVNTHLR